ncbi:hypothetical protein ScPMuIL_011477 [Solemya velum]
MGYVCKLNVIYGQSRVTCVCHKRTVIVSFQFRTDIQTVKKNLPAMQYTYNNSTEEETHFTMDSDRGLCIVLTCLAAVGLVVAGISAVCLVRLRRSRKTNMSEKKTDEARQKLKESTDCERGTL